MDKQGPKCGNCQFKVKFGTKTDLNMQNQMVIFAFLCFLRELPILGKFVPNNQNYQFKLKFGNYIFFFRVETPFLGKFE